MWFLIGFINRSMHIYAGLIQRLAPVIGFDHEFQDILAISINCL